MTRPDNATSLPSVHIGEFVGPLDLLLCEVRRQKVAVEKIAMAPIVARFLEYVRSAADRNLNLDIEWLDMAATLIEWKSRSLLPPDSLDAFSTDPIRDGLVRQLLLHRREVAEGLAERCAVEQTRFSRANDKFGPVADALPDECSYVSVWELMLQARDIGLWVHRHREGRRNWRETFGIAKDDVTVSQMMDHLRGRFGAMDERLDGTELLAEQPTASRKACLFLGILELVREQEIEIEQGEQFGPFVIRWVGDRTSLRTPIST